MGTIFAKLLGTPEIFYDGRRITFDLRKAEALFYYLLVKKQVLRDELVNILWPDESEKIGKKKLRNAVYTIRKVFDTDILVSPKRSVIMLDEKLQWEIDLDEFLEENKSKSIGMYKGEFLQGFLVKDADDFERWIFQERDKYRDIYISRLEREIESYIQQKNLSDAEAYCKELIKVDELNEDAYRRLMKIYCFQEQYNKGIEIYQKLVKILKEELFITPDIDTINMFEMLMKEKSIKESVDQEQKQEFYYGREKEVEILKRNQYKFTSRKDGKSIVILGEAGIGKSRLMNEFLKASSLEQVYVLDTYCYQAEENYLLKPWNGIFTKLSRIVNEEDIEIPSAWRSIVSYIFPVFYAQDCMTEMNQIENIDILKYQVAEKAIVNVLSKVAKTKKIILLFEDIQWIDEMSLTLLKNVVLENRNTSLIFIATCRDGYDEKIDKFLTEMVRYNLVNKIELYRLNKNEVIDFAQQALPAYPFTQQLNDLMYKETEGNTFFLVEFLNNLKQNGHIGKISSKMKDILENRILNVSVEGQKILRISSIFFDKVTFAELQALSGKNELALMDIVEELQRKCLIKEIVLEGESQFVFTHQKLREYIYIQTPLYKRKILHNRIAKLLEGQLKNNKIDMLLYSKLIYHFTNGGNKFAALKYSIKNLAEYLHFNHEIFPVLSDVSLVQQRYLYLSQEQALKQLKEVEALLEQVRKEENREELKKIELSFLHMIGRIYVRQGDYEQGLNIIENIINHALQLEDYNAALNGYRQMFCYCMNTLNTEAMKEYIHKAFQIVDKSGQKGGRGILLRLKGYLRIMEGKYDEAEALIDKAIVILNKLNDEDQYIVNIAAAYHFMGESKRHQCKFDEAIYYYAKGISLCEEKNLIRGLGVIYANAGQAAFDMGDYSKAKYYIRKAVNMYEQLDYLWGRSIANGYMAYLLFLEEKYEKSLVYLKKAEEDARKLKSPYEMGLVLKAKAEIRWRMDHSKSKDVFREYLTQPMEVYCDEAIDKLRRLHGCYEIEKLKQLKIMNKK